MRRSLFRFACSIYILLPFGNYFMLKFHRFLLGEIMQILNQSGAARLFRNVGGAFMLAIAIAVASCGGGGGGGGGSSGGSGSGGAAVASLNISGYVVEGTVSGATVKLYRLDAAGARTLLGSTVTDTTGFYTIGTSAPAGTNILVEASGGGYIDAISRTTMLLSVPLRAATSLTGSSVTVSLTPYSEAAVRLLEHAATADWSATGIAAANQKVADKLALNALLDFLPVELIGAAPASNARQNDINLSFFTYGFAGFAHRLDPNPSTSLASALDGFYTILAVDEHDDKVLPAFFGGMGDFADHSNLTMEPGGQLNMLLTGVVGAVRDNFKPLGLSSGGATAPMPDDAFQVVGTTAAGAMFNKRGALIAYPGYGDSGTWITLLGASAAEVFGDGDIGIGRWNGGTTVGAIRAGSKLTPTSSGAWLNSSPYAVARAATNVPTCGVRRLPLVASTLASQAGDGTAALPALTADSSVSLQYASDPLLGFDIGVRIADGSVVRFRSTGGIDGPWASNIRLSDLAKTGVSTIHAATGENIWMAIQGLASGNGENKLVLKISLSLNVLGATEFAAAFAAPTAGVDLSGCAAAVGEPGTAIDPAPANGSHDVLFGIEPGSAAAAFGGQVSFRTRGELSSAANLQVGATTPVYELAGTADASIGRIDGPYTLGGASYRKSLPYAVARAGAIIPAGVNRHYVLVASTSVVPLLSDTTGELPAGRVQTANLDVHFGADTMGIPGQWDSLATFSASGSVEGVPFIVSVPGAPDAPVVIGFRNGDTTFTSNDQYIRGVFAAPSADYAVVAFTARVGGRPASGTLLFRAQ